MLSMLAVNAGITSATQTDGIAEPNTVVVTLAIRDGATCELRILNDRIDGLAILQMIEEQTGGNNANA
jgi:hypothetical protein